MKIFITGASSGFGKQAVMLLLKSGHKVIAGIRGGDSRGAEIYKDLAPVLKENLTYIDIHMDNSESILNSSKELMNLFNDDLDVLINNAGFGLIGPMEDLTMDQIRYQFDVNFFGVVELTNLLLPALRKSKGKIFNISSMGGRFSFPFYGAYHASKFAIEGYSESLQLELKPHGVQVAIIEPGAFKTEFLHGSSKWPEVEGSVYTRDFKAFCDLQSKVFNKGASNPIKVAELINHLVKKNRIALRYPVGVDSKLITFFSKYLPTGIWNFIMKLAYSFSVR